MAAVNVATGGRDRRRGCEAKAQLVGNDLRGAIVDASKREDDGGGVRILLVILARVRAQRLAKEEMKGSQLEYTRSDSPRLTIQ